MTSSHGSTFVEAAMLTRMDSISRAAGSPNPQRTSTLARIPLFFCGVLVLLLGLAIYIAAVAMSLVGWLAGSSGEVILSAAKTMLWWSQIPAVLGFVLIAIDLFVLLKFKRSDERRIEPPPATDYQATVALTAYNDQESVADAVTDFSAHPRVRRVIVVDNNSRDATSERASRAGAIVVVEKQPGYGRCVFRCLTEALRYEDTALVVLCEGDCTFRANDLDKLFAYVPHADIVNGTRIVEQLRDIRTQLSTFMYYGNFFVGKLLEAKHLGRGTFTDVGTTYKAIHRDALARLLPSLDPAINLEFNAHFMDIALANRFLMVECPLTFHPRVGASKGGNVNNRRALKTGLKMILGLTFGWKLLR